MIDFGLDTTEPEVARTSCVGLSRTECWDAPSELRGERLTGEALVEHARELARSHGAPSTDVPAARLRARFAAVQRTLRAAYERLSKTASGKHEATPAEQWLLDNAHVVAEQLREIEEDLPSGYLAKLPRLGSGAMSGFPRVYGLCLDYLRHTDARIDLEDLVAYVSAYEEVSVLTIGEIWAVPIMLRMGLILSVTARAAADDANVAEEAERYVSPLLAPGRYAEVDDAPLSPALIVEIRHRMREHDAPNADEWIRKQAARLGSTPEELARQHNLRQAADQLSVGNAITSMRSIAAFSWNEFFERVSHVEKTLREDPGAAYETTDPPTRDRCRHAVEAISRRSRASECEVAKAAIALADAADPGDATLRHVGYYLIDAGRRELERRVGYRPTLGDRVIRIVESSPTFAYLFPTLGVSSALLVGAAVASDGLGLSTRVTVVLLVLLALPASEIALTLVNTIVSVALPPRLLAKLSFKKGIPEAHRTLVVVPCLLDGTRGIEKLLGDLEIRSLANSDARLHYALVTDFTDHHEKDREDDAPRLALVERGIEALNERYPGPDGPRYFLFHRARVHNANEGVWMGWERKRGKLDELNLLMRGSERTSFVVATAPRELLRTIKYVITLDADTGLPRETARRMVATMAHPLNRPKIDPRSGLVTRGYGLLQPRIGTRPESTRATRFAWLTAGPAGIDPYTSAVSDVYQDLFAEGSYIGKGIYDVDAFKETLDGRVPESTLLSHDLFEGLHARTALATDIELYDDQPSTYRAEAARDHRWVRGDWQLLPWLFGAPKGARKNTLGFGARFRIFDNLRRSLVAPSLVLALAFAWASSAEASLLTLLAAASLFFAPIVARLLVTVARRSSDRPWTPTYQPLKDLAMNLLRAGFSASVLLDRALLMTDAIGRTLYRIVVSRRPMLEWTTSGQAERLLRKRGRYDVRTLAASTLSIALFGAIAWVDASRLPYAAPLLIGWVLAPYLAAALGEPRIVESASASLSLSDRAFLRRTAHQTWQFFEKFVGDEDHHLPPDNFQEAPRPVVAHRTSPTNIGLYLLSTVAARDFAFITLGETARRLTETLATMDRLEKRDGHVLNWYDTTTLRPLEPLYISTVDSGNLAGYLIALNEAARDLASAPLIGEGILETALHALQRIEEREALFVNGKTLREARLALASMLEGSREAIKGSLFSAAEALERLCAAAKTLSAAAAWLDDPIVPSTAEAIEADLRKHLCEIAGLAPWVMVADEERAALEALHAARSVADVASSTAKVLESEGLSDEIRARLEASRDASGALVERFEGIAGDARRLVEGMSFRSLYDEERALFAIGYNVSSGRMDASHYDLLASEARLASFIAIANGDVPLEHWFRLGRPRSDLSSGPVLMSWSGSMFEYLMPLLVMRRHAGTLLDETYASAVARQMEYGRDRNVPWGVSEAAYNTMDLSMTYQYRAFGVPGLGLKAGLDKDLVVAPYASVLSTLVAPVDAVTNLRELADDGLLGDYGFYESIDFTVAHRPPQRPSVIVRAFMAHHQGMSLVAIDNVLHGGVMQERFHRDAHVRATELLLEERIPIGVPLTPPIATTLAAPPATDTEVDVYDYIELDVTRPIRAHLLGHGELSTLVTATGAGVTTYKGVDVHRYREDAALSSSGIFVYVRDLDSGEFWSIGHQPTLKQPDSYGATFAADRVEIRRRDGDIESLVEIAVSPEHPADVRRITLTNHGGVTRNLEVTTYTEVVLAPRAADRNHPAFSSMFIETESLPQQSAMLARRRARSPSETPIWLVQVLSAEDGEWQSVELGSSRARFIGRGNSIANPIGLTSPVPLSVEGEGSVDPAMVLRRIVELPPGKRARVSLTSALSNTRPGALALGELFLSSSSVARTFELAWADARVELRHLGISGLQAKRFQELLSFIVQPCAELRHRASAADIRGSLRETLWAQGISGDMPIVVARLDDPESADLVRELVLAHEFWRLNGVEVDLVVLNEEPSGYLQPVQEEALQVIASSPAQAKLNQRGGVFVRRTEQLTREGRTLLLASARVVLASSAGSLARQLRRALAKSELPTIRRVPPSLEPRQTARVERSTSLLFDNGLGGFSQDGREYVITVGDERRTEAPWCNVIANACFGTLVSERGAAFTWSQNSQSHRLTPWSNDAVSDPSGESIFIRDEDSRELWSPTPGPAGAGRTYEVRHGQGYTKFLHTAAGLAHELVTFVDLADPVKITRLTITNRGEETRNLSVFGVVEWVLGANRDVSRLTVVTDWNLERSTVVAQNPFSGHPERRAFFASSATAASFTCDRETFFGISGARSAPLALVGDGAASLAGESGSGIDPCAALEVSVSIPPGETVEVSFVLGEGRNGEHALALSEKHRELSASQRSLDAVVAHWDDLLSTITIRTPDPSIDVMANRWLLYQVLSARIWGRTAFYQSGGAFGFRDQLQDVLALIHADRSIAREHILRAAARQFVEGDVQHWWHPGSGEGVRTRCSDDLLWLPYVVSHYVATTGEKSILDEQVPFLESRALRPDEHDLFSVPNVSSETASLYDHATRAIDAGITSGMHGLPLMKGGDWNDGMSEVGAKGIGESVWLAWFIVKTLRDFLPIARARGDEARVERYGAEISRILAAVEAHAWDGGWYRRATFDDGALLGSASSVECNIDAIAQSWATIAGGDPTRAERALRASEDALVRETSKIMTLLWPPFDGEGSDPGYIRAYPSGVRENGGQYTHGVLWTALAETIQGHGERAASLLTMFNPIHHAADPESRARYAVEPYVVAADIYAGPGVEGRGGWTWYTGAASWMYRVMIEHLLGIQLKDGRLSFAPCIPPTWPGYEVDYRCELGELLITVENPQHISKGVVRVELDGVLVPDGRIALTGSGEKRKRRVRVIMSSPARAVRGDESRASS